MCDTAELPGALGHSGAGFTLCILLSWLRLSWHEECELWGCLSGAWQQPGAVSQGSLRRSPRWSKPSRTEPAPCCRGVGGLAGCASSLATTPLKFKGKSGSNEREFSI